MRLYWSFFLFFHCWKVRILVPIKFDVRHISTWMFLKKLSCPQVSNISSPHSIWMHLTVETKSSFDRRPWVWTRSSLPAMSALLPRWNDFAALTMFFSHWKHMKWPSWWNSSRPQVWTSGPWHAVRSWGPVSKPRGLRVESKRTHICIIIYVRTYVLFFVSIFLQTFISVYLAVWS